MRKSTKIFVCLFCALTIAGLIPIITGMMRAEVDYISEKELITQTEKALKGDADAMWYLAKRHHLYFDEDSAAYWAQKAHYAGNKSAGYYMGYMWGIDVNDVKSPGENWIFRKKDYYLRTATMGMYNGAPYDIPYLRKWAKLGLPHAIREYYNLHCYDASHYPPISEEAFAILINGAKKGIPEFQYLAFIDIYERGASDEAMDWLYITANNPKKCHARSQAQRILAKKYLNGDTVHKIKPDIPLAMYWMERVINDSDDNRDIECEKYNYQICVDRGYTAATVDNTSFNRNPSGKYFWNNTIQPKSVTTSFVAP